MRKILKTIEKTYFTVVYVCLACYSLQAMERFAKSAETTWQVAQAYFINTFWLLMLVIAGGILLGYLCSSCKKQKQEDNNESNQ